MSTISNNIFLTFGEAFSFAIDLHRLSQSDFAEKWGKDRAQISKYVNNVSVPRPQSVKEIEDLLNVKFVNSDEKWVVLSEEHSQVFEPGQPYRSVSFSALSFQEKIEFIQKKGEELEELGLYIQSMVLKNDFTEKEKDIMINTFVSRVKEIANDL